MTHEEARDLINRYHLKAMEIYARHENVHIAQIKNVQLTSEGAFVEAMIWIDKKDLDGIPS